MALEQKLFGTLKGNLYCFLKKSSKHKLKGIILQAMVLYQKREQKQLLI